MCRATGSFPSGAAGGGRAGRAFPESQSLRAWGPIGRAQMASCHPKSARCFPPFTAGCGSLRNKRAKLLAYAILLNWRYVFPLSYPLTVDPGTVEYALDV